MKTHTTQVLFSLIFFAMIAIFADDYRIVDTGQELCYNNSSEITPPSAGSPFYGQDAQFDGHTPSYLISGDGLTVFDNNTGLTWMQSPDLDGDGDIDVEDKLTWDEVRIYPEILNAANYGGYSDWRVPTIKELYSLIKFDGQDPSGYTGSMIGIQPFIDNDVFHFAYGDTSGGERVIDAQYASNTVYNESSIPGVPKLFGVNFADGRIKGYDTQVMGGDKTFTLLCVRGNPDYGTNAFWDNGDGTITDSSTNLMWQKSHSPTSLSWEDALAYAETLTTAGYDDWRLPNAKELQSIVDYSRSPGTSGAAIDPVFDCASITNEDGKADYPWFWTGTTHASVHGGSAAVYVCFGRAAGWMKPPGRTYYIYVDVHGAGAQRSDPKTGSPTDYYLGVDSLGNPVYGHGPQGDIIRVYNFARCVRNDSSMDIGEGIILPAINSITACPNPFNSTLKIGFNQSVQIESGVDSLFMKEAKEPTVEVLDVSGRRIDGGVRMIVGHRKNSYEYLWSPPDDLSSGVYFVRVKAAGSTSIIKAVYMK